MKRPSKKERLLKLQRKMRAARERWIACDALYYEWAHRAQVALNTRNAAWDNYAMIHEKYMNAKEQARG